MMRELLIFGVGALTAWFFLREPMVEDHFKAARDHLEKAKEFTRLGDKDNAWLNRQEAKQHLQLLSEGEKQALKKEFGAV